LSSPPASPSRIIASLPVAADAPAEAGQESFVAALPVVAEVSSDAEVIPGSRAKTIRPYLDPKYGLNYYGMDDYQIEAIEEPEDIANDADVLENGDNDDLEVDREASKEPETVENDPMEPRTPVTRTPEPSQGQQLTATLELSRKLNGTTAKAPARKLGFPKLTPMDVFESFLKNPEDMTYEELYDRTALVSESLVAYQDEWDEIDKETTAYESAEKAALKRVEERNKEATERERLFDNERRDRIRITYTRQVDMTAKEFAQWAAEYEKENPESECMKYLMDLRDSKKMAAINKKIAAENKKKESVLEGAPPDKVPAKTKEETAIDDKKRLGRLKDPSEFEEQMLKDAYGKRRVRSNNLAGGTNGEDTALTAGEAETNRARTRRNTTKKYAAEFSPSPETEEEGLPAKRARKPKIYEDGVETAGRSRVPSRSATPVVRTFPSGKRVGRPPTKSKLQAVQTVSKSVSPHAANGTEPRELGPLEEAQLHDAAESLVNQTVFDQAAAPPVKKKHAGGRPRKIRPEASTAVSQPAEPADVPVSKPRNKGGRPRKNRIQAPPESTIKIETAPQADVQLGEENGILQSTEQGDEPQEPEVHDSGKSKRKRSSAESDESQIIVDPAPIESADPSPTKKRRTRKQIEDDFEPETPIDGKRKRDTTFDESTGPPSPEERLPPAKKRKTRGGKSVVSEVSEAREEDDSDAGIDEESLDPAAREALRLKRIKKEKSRKLSRSMKARWASGGMQEAQETRRMNNAKKKAEKQAATLGGPAALTVDTNLPIAPPPATPSAATKGPKAKKETTSRKAKPLPPPRPASTRVRRPARIGGMDGADDEFDEDDNEIEKQFASEYDRYQALTSPRSPVVLGKRVRRTLFDLSQEFNDEEDDNTEEYESEE